MKLNRIFYTLCCLSMLSSTALAQQNNGKEEKHKYFNAKDYLMQKRYIPAGKPWNEKEKWRNLSIGISGGASRLVGSGSWLPLMKEIGISAAYDVSSFNSFRATLTGAANNMQKRVGLELDHIFRIQDYVMGWHENKPFSIDMVWGIGGYGVKPQNEEMKIAYGLHGGLIFSRRMGRNMEIFVEPRLNLYSDEIDALVSDKRYDLGFQVMAGLKYRFNGYRYKQEFTRDVLDNFFYEGYFGASGDFSNRTWSSLKMKTLGPTAGLSLGKWLYPIGFRASMFAGFRYVPGPTTVGRSEEPFAGARLEGMINLNSFLNLDVTDPRFELNIAGGYELGLLAHRGGGVYASKIRPFHGPTVAIQPVFFIRPDWGVFAQARWSSSQYNQSFTDGRVEHRNMMNLNLEFGVQYRRRYEEMEKKKGLHKFEPYNFVSAQVGANFPLHNPGLSMSALMNALGQQFALSLGRRYSPYAAIRTSLEAARYKGSKMSSYPLSVSADFMVDAVALSAGYNSERVVSFLPFAGIVYTHHETMEENYFGVQGGADLTFRINDKWGIFLEGAVRLYNGRITSLARPFTNRSYTLVPNGYAGVTYKF